MHGVKFLRSLTMHRTQGTREGFAPDSDLEATPKKQKRKTKRKRSTKKGSKFLGEPIPKSPQRTRVINIVSKWVQAYGIKPRSKYVLKMDTILADRLRPDDWNKDGLPMQDVAKDIIREFKDRYPEFMRVLYQRNKEPVAHRPPKWSKATLQKREATKEKK